MPVSLRLRAAVQTPKVLKGHRTQPSDLYVDTYDDVYGGGTPPPRYRANAKTVITLKAQKAGS